MIIEVTLTARSGLANLSSVYGSYIWPKATAPNYVPGFVATTVFQVCTLVFAILAWQLLARYPYPGKQSVLRGDHDVERL